MDIKDIQNLIKFIARSGVNEVSYKDKNFEIKVKKEANSTTSVVQPIMQSPVTAAVPQVPVAQPEEVNNTAKKEATSATEDESKYITIKSPMIGTFYRKPSPDKDVFVNVGDTVSVGSVVCIIEAMKLFNEIESEVSGKIVKILVDDSTPVEYDQPLFLVDPS